MLAGLCLYLEDHSNIFSHLRNYIKAGEKAPTLLDWFFINMLQIELCPKVNQISTKKIWGLSGKR